MLAADPISQLAAQGTAAIPAATFRGTFSIGDRVGLIQIRWSDTEPRIQIAAPIGMDDSTSRPMRRDPSGDTLIAPRLDGDVLRGTVRQGERTGMFALRRVVELPLGVLKPLGGDYRLDDGSLFSTGADNAFDGLTYIHFGTGWTGSLFAVDSTRFIAGPRRYDTDPVRARPEIDLRRVGVWGISQGGWPASILAARDSSLVFVILHAGSSLTPAMQGEDEMRLTVQVGGGTKEDLDGLLRYYRRYNDVRGGRATRQALDSLSAALRAQGNRFIWSPENVTSARSRWLAGINDFDPAPYWSRARVPVLALFGEFDGYVPPETNVPVFRAAFARSGNPDTSIVVFRNANHRFEETSRRMTSDWVIGTRYLPEYYNTMAAWLDRQLTRAKK